MTAKERQRFEALLIERYGQTAFDRTSYSMKESAYEYMAMGYNLSVEDCKNCTGFRRHKDKMDDLKIELPKL